MSQLKQCFAGIDWASEKHDVWVTDCAGKRLGYKTFPHSGEGLAAMCAWLITMTGAEPEQVNVAIEVPHGPVVETLLDRRFVVWALNPKQLDRFRDRFTMSGAKDDSRDAETMASALRTDGRAFRRLALAEPALIELREWSRIAEDLTAERTRLANRVREQLWRYYPQMLAVESDVSAPWLLDLWEVVPTPAKAAKVRESKIASVLKDNRIRRIDAAGVLAILHAEPVRVAPGATEAAVAHIGSLVERLRVVVRQLKQAHAELDRINGALAEPKEPEPGQQPGHATPRSSTPCQVSEGSRSPRCRQKLGMPCSAETTPLCAPCAGLLRSRSDPARAVWSSGDTPATPVFATPSTTGHASPRSAMTPVVPSTMPCASAVTVMAARSARLPTGC